MGVPYTGRFWLHNATKNKWTWQLKQARWRTTTTIL